MNISNVLDEKIVNLKLKGQNKEEVIEELSDMLLAADYIEDKQNFIKDIYLREDMGMTGIGNFIAIPHGQSDAVKKVGVAIGKTTQEIDWETIDDQGVKLIFLFAVSNDKEYATNHMKLLANLAGKLGNDQAVMKLLESSSFEELRSVFNE